MTIFNKENILLIITIAAFDFLVIGSTVLVWFGEYFCCIIRRNCTERIEAGVKR